MKISMVGTGYVGLVSGTCFSETGINVTCVDVDQEKIQRLNQGIVPIYEPGLETLIEKNVKKERLYFTTSLKESIVEAEAAFIAVGTPPDEDGSADLKYVLDVAREIGRHIDHYMVIVTKSTVPIGTAEKVKSAIQGEIDKRSAEVEFDVASNPEFLKEGDAVEDFLRPDRIVIGTESERAEEALRRLYKPFLLNQHPILFMDIPSAELTKYAANSMLATKISFINDIANLCEAVGADVNQVRMGIGSDSRIGYKFIYAGTGYGGSCFPKDVKALIKTSDEHNHSLELLKAVERVNERQKGLLFEKLKQHFHGALKGKKIALWGLSFKPNTDDMREAPSITIIEKLTKAGAKVTGYDPIAMQEAKRKLGNKIEYTNDQYEAIRDADALILVTEWSEFRVPQWDKMEKLMKNKLIFDGRNIYEPKDMEEWGWTYYGIGRPPVNVS
ncbi:MAG: UDP-glucose/GDP-mannose dehydrogenase family protein [Bacteroidales bacterium]|nr:UDP-glucose/GDP-mannose dehydrogenase family protein [Bacteroidales bacterium]